MFGMHAPLALELESFLPAKYGGWKVITNKPHLQHWKSY